MNTRGWVNGSDREEGEKWFSSPTVTYGGIPSVLRGCIPEFERRSLSLSQPGQSFSSLNPRLDMIVRKPYGPDDRYLPIGAVSKEYRFIPHAEIFDRTMEALGEAGINPDDTVAELTLTEYGERMTLRIIFPPQYVFDPGDGHPVALRLECYNSVEGSTRFKVFLGWFRFICSNGLIIGVTKAHFQRRHVASLAVADIASVLMDGLIGAKEEMEHLHRWQNQTVGAGALERWINVPVCNAWGFKAATRVYRIARTGRDARIVGPYKDNAPTTVPVELLRPVSGSPPRAETLYDISQILAWLARQRRDVQEQLEWREQIPELMGKLAS